jgi:murein L,D-transpeptidase YcbB/YkuD
MPDTTPCDEHAHRSERLAAVFLAATVSICSQGLRADVADPVRAQIALTLSSYSVPARGASSQHGATEALHAAYARTADAPLWSHDGRATSQAQALMRELQHADAYGLPAENYSTAAAPAAANDAVRWGQFDVQLSDAALRFMSDLHYGRVDPATAGFKLAAPHHQLDLAASLDTLAHAPEVGAALGAVEPPFYHYKLLKAALLRYLSLAQHPELRDLPAAPRGLGTGEAYAGAPALRRLLLALGDLPPASGQTSSDTTFDAELSAAVRAFQQRHGLTPDGTLDKSTFAALTTPFEHRVRQIDLTLERWRWLSPFQTPPIIVNIPQFRLFAFRTTEDRVASILEMDVIVGRTYPRTQTPVFESNMRYVVLRPYWDVPSSITRNEMLPKLRANPAYLAAQHLEIVNGQADSSPVVAPTPENIEALAEGRLRLRQQPGEDNALGLIKFMFPNTYNVYLHSTPAHQLFKETVRAFSHGCIRVSDPLALATLVLKDASGDWTSEKIDAAMHGSKTLRINLSQPIDVLILYGTALATEAGPTMFFEDIYGYDRKLERQLGLAALR